MGPYFAKKFRLKYYLPLKAIISGFRLPVFAHVGQYEAKPHAPARLYRVE